MSRYRARVSYEFDLVADDGAPQFDAAGYKRARFLLSEFQPATRVDLVGSPPTRIRVTAEGAPAEVAGALLDEVAQLVGRRLRFEFIDARL